MGISRYLAMTKAEMASSSLQKEEKTAFMACHFSPYGTGLSNLPTFLPPDAMLILNDRTPICGHDPIRITQEVTEVVERFSCGCVLLDFERLGFPETQALCECLVSSLSCPVGVAAEYGKDLDCPVFLPPMPLDVTMEAHLAPWQGREVWLDIAPDAARISVTKDGSTYTPLSDSFAQTDAFEDAALHCYYHTEILQDRIDFYLRRNWKAQILDAERRGVTKCVGLYQQLCSNFKEI
jgi:hypothetical protein